MAYIATVATVQGLGNLPKVSDEKINAHFPMAKIDVVDVIGKEAYDGIEAVTNPYTSHDKDKIEQAESYMVLKYLIPSINIESTGGGVTKATGFGDSRKENLSEYDLERIIQRCQDNAMKILQQYAKSVDEDENGAEDILMIKGLSMACIGDDEC